MQSVYALLDRYLENNPRMVVSIESYRLKRGIMWDCTIFGEKEIFTANDSNREIAIQRAIEKAEAK